MSLSPAVGVGGNGSGSSGTGPITPHPLLGALGTYHARNRDYDPLRGLWLQSEPNGSGQVVQKNLHHSGRGCALCPAPMVSPSDMLRDGPNLHAYLRGRVVEGSDPSGLDFTLGGALMTGQSMFDSATSAMEEAYSGVVTAFNLGAMLDEYAFMQDADADWAMDWDAFDFDSFVSGVAAEAYGYSYGDASKCDEGGGIGDDDGPIMAMARVGKVYHGNSKKSKAKVYNYDIKYKKPGDAKWRKAKNGVSSSPLNAAGQSKRAVMQIEKFKNTPGLGDFKWSTKITKTSYNRATALNKERCDSASDLKNIKNGLPAQHRPRPDGAKPGPW